MVQCKNVKVLYFSKLSSVGKISNYAIFYIGFKVLFSVNYPKLGLKSAHPIGLACGGTSTRDWVVTLHMLLRSDESAEPVLGLVPGEP